MTGIAYHSLRVAELVEETADARSIVFEVPDELRERFAYKPGQFVTLHVPCADKPLPRCYSASSAPALGEALRVTVKRVADGRASNWLCGTLKVGDRLDVAAPAGLFTSKSVDGDFLLFAGGSGVTPVYSILRTVLASGRGRALLVYANRDERSVIFARELARLAREHPSRLQIVHWLDSVQGITSAAQLGALCKPWLAQAREAQAFICGPGPYMDAAAAALRDIGMAPAQIHIERFVSLPEDADELPAAVADSDAPGARVEVTLDGRTLSLDVPAGQLLIDAFEAAGLQPPYSCRAGACAACMCRLEAGEVAMRHNHVLDAHDLDDGWILACQAVAISPEVRIRYPDP